MLLKGAGLIALMAMLGALELPVAGAQEVTAQDDASQP
jgi:hypothetical protein